MGKQPSVWYKTHKKEFVEQLCDLSGTDQATADQMLNLVLCGLAVWLKANLQCLLPNAGARLLLPGVGRLDVTIVARGRRNAERVASGQVGPPPTTARVEFCPCESLKETIRRSNCDLNRPYPGIIETDPKRTPLRGSGKLPDARSREADSTQNGQRA